LLANQRKDVLLFEIKVLCVKPEKKYGKKYPCYFIRPFLESIGGKITVNSAILIVWE